MGLLLPAACADQAAEPDLDAGDASTGDASSSGSDAAAEPEGPVATYTYWRDAKAILDAKCGGCHQPDDIAPFPLTTYEQVRAVAAVLPASLEAETMPPWPPADGCQEYAHARSLDEADKALLLTWLDEGAPEGDPADAPAPEPEPGAEPQPEPWSPTMTVEMPEPYSPVTAPDDYRCFLVPWTQAETSYVTGYRVVPGNRSIVHHVIMFNADASVVPQLQAMDDADPGPGYACFGGTGTAASWVGSWAPGGGVAELPPDTGIRIEPGSMMVVQMHYNTLASDPAPDQTAIELTVAEQVERPALTIPFANFEWITGADPMLIPAGDPQVTHEYAFPVGNPLFRQRLSDVGVMAGEPFVVHSAGLHMHYLGTAGTLSVVRGGGGEDCLLDIEDWDFGWQGGYTLREPLRVDADDQLRISCTWDNSAGNQPTIGGEVLTPHDVEWGEGTTDEMCLGVIYVSAP
ncbi:MAG: monooxygenase [Myxococcales bacterium]|nr:monooxygenase [Myxococcales bacterium]